MTPIIIRVVGGLLSLDDVVILFEGEVSDGKLTGCSFRLGVSETAE